MNLKTAKINTTSILAFVKVPKYDVENLYKISKEISTKYINSAPSGQSISSIHLQYFIEGSPKKLRRSGYKRR